MPLYTSVSAESVHPNAPATPAFAGPLLAGRYRLDGLIGQGGMGQVHRAWDTHLGRRVAIKVLAPELAADAEIGARLRAEARHLAATEHPNLVTLFDVSDGPGTPYLVMELVEGESLAERMRRDGPLAAREIASVVAGIAAGLSALHGAGIVHRDVSPANILVGRDGRPRLADFGLAHDIRGHRRVATADGMVQGTLHYLAPELLDGGFATPASDVYSLAAVAYAALLGRPPAVATSVATLRHAHREPPIRPSLLRPGLDPAIDTVLLAALGPAVGRPSAYQFALAVTAALRDSDDLPFEAFSSSMAGRGVRRASADGGAPAGVIDSPVRRAVLALVGAAALLGLGAMSIAAVDGALGSPRIRAPIADGVAIVEPPDRLLLGQLVPTPAIPPADLQVADTSFTRITITGPSKAVSGGDAVAFVAQAQKRDHVTREREREDRARHRATKADD